MSQRKRVKVNFTEEAKLYCTKKVDPSGFEKHWIDDVIGYGVFAVKDFEKGSFLLEYSGEHITQSEGEKRMTTYSEAAGSYLFFFKDICIDATFDNRLGKYVNDSPYGNCVMRSVQIEGQLHLCLFALTNLPSGIELRYSYGVPGLPWRKDPKRKFAMNLSMIQPISYSKCNKDESISNEDTIHKDQIDFQLKERMTCRDGVVHIDIEPGVDTSEEKDWLQKNPNLCDANKTALNYTELEMKDEKLSWVPFQNLKDVPEDVVVKMIRHVGKKILDIFSGKVYCERHETYNLKGRKRACLAMEVSFGNFTDEQENVIFKTLANYFCAVHSKYFDYVAKVLFPETKKLLQSLFSTNADKTMLTKLSVEEDNVEENKDLTVVTDVLVANQVVTINDKPKDNMSVIIDTDEQIDNGLNDSGEVNHETEVDIY